MDEPGVLYFINPATGEQFGQVEITSVSEAHHSMGEMREAVKIWSAKPVRERVRILGEFQRLLVDSLDEISAVITRDTGKSRQDAAIEVFLVADFLKQNRRLAARWLRRRRVSHGLLFLKRCYVEPRPHGVVLVIAPWNYPFFLTLAPVLVALLAGNTVILKPSELTCAVGLMIQSLFQKIPELTPFVRVAFGDGSVGAALVQARPDFIFVTGSTGTGRKVMQMAAENLIPGAFELGGKDALIVLEDADIEKAAYWSVWGSTYNAGQSCISIERVYVVGEVYDRFLAQAKKNINQYKVGFSEGLICPFDMGPMTDPRQLRNIERQMEDALAKGAHVVVGGRSEGMFLSPILLVDVNHDMLIMREETFGPIMAVMKVKGEAEAVRMVNDSPYGLGASVWSKDLKRAQRVASQIKAGSVDINDTMVQFAIPMLPIGGIGDSGFGRIHGEEGLLQFTRTHSYVVGNPPASWDPFTLVRKPGHYALLSNLIYLMLGTNMQQRLKPLAKFLSRRRR